MTSPTAPHRYRSRSTSLLERPVLGRAFERAGEGVHSRSCSGSSGEALTPDPSPHGKAVHYAICELGESALDDSEVDDVGRVGLFANGARWGWPSGGGPVHPNRRLSASLSLGGQSLPSTFNIAPLARVMSAGAARAPSARSLADSNTPEGLGLFRRLSVGFGPKVRTQSAAFQSSTDGIAARDLAARLDLPRPHPHLLRRRAVANRFVLCRAGARPSEDWWTSAQRREWRAKEAGHLADGREDALLQPLIASPGAGTHYRRLERKDYNI